VGIGTLKILKDTLRRIPGTRPLYHSTVRQYMSLTLGRQSPETIFTDIFRHNGWKGTESISGRGSDLEQTESIRKQLPDLLQTLGVRSMLDIPCGDCHWMRRVDLRGVRYIGGDIVAALVEANRKSEPAERRFQRLDLMCDELPRADLILCRDCLVHLSFRDDFTALRNMTRSGAKFFLLTTFPSRKSNRDIVTGQWRPLNLQADPFNFAEPISLMNEGCTASNGIYGDKSLGLWSAEQILRSMNPADLARL